jgi:hypothetical protein
VEPIKGIRNVWALDGLNNIEASLTLAHEASHIFGPDEPGARRYEAELLIELPRYYLKVAPEREKGWLKQGPNGFVVNEQAIRGYVKKRKTYQDTKEAKRPRKVRKVRYQKDENGNDVIDFGGKPDRVTGFHIIITPQSWR